MIIDNDIFYLIESLNVNGLQQLLMQNQNYVIQQLHSYQHGPRTPLMAALQRLHHAFDDEQERAREVVDLILNACLNLYHEQLTIPDNHGLTPLGAAILYRNEEVCARLIAVGVPLDGFCCNDGLLPLEFAAHRGLLRFVVALLARGAPYRVDFLPVNLEIHFAHESMTTMLILYRALRRAPYAARLIAAIFMNLEGQVGELVSDPRSRRPINGEAWSVILIRALPHHDNICAILIPYLCHTFSMQQCLAIAIDKNSPLTFQAALNCSRTTLDINARDTYQLARMAFERHRPQWATALLMRYAEILTDMLIEPIDTFLDGTEVTPETLQARGIEDHSISPFLGENPVGQEINLIPDYFDNDMEEVQALANLMVYVLNDDTDQTLNALLDAIPDNDEATTSEAVGALLNEAIAQNNHARLRRLLRLPLTEALLSAHLPGVIANNNIDLALILLEGGANPTITHTGEILDPDNDQTIPRLNNLLPYTLLVQALGDENNPIPLRNALILLSFNVTTTFELAGGQSITLIEVAATTPNALLARTLAVLGMDPCPYFTAFLTQQQPTEVEVGIVINVIEGLHACWNTIQTLGFYCRYLFVKAYMIPTGNQLVIKLGELYNCQTLPHNVRNLALALATEIAAIDIHQQEPLFEKSARIVLLDDDLSNNFHWGELGPPWDSPMGRDIVSYASEFYDNRENLTPETAAQLLIRICSLCVMRNGDPVLALRILQILMDYVIG